MSNSRTFSSPQREPCSPQQSVCIPGSLPPFLPHTPRKEGKKKAAPPPTLTPSRLIFSTVAPSPNAGSKMGTQPSPGSLSKAPKPAVAGATSPLSSLRSLFVRGGPGRDMFYFRLFIGIIFFLAVFLSFLAWGRQRKNAHRLVSFASSRLSALSLVCAPVSSLLSLLSPLAPASFQLRPQPLRPTASAPRLSFPRPYCPFSPFALPPLLLSVLLLFLFLFPFFLLSLLLSASRSPSPFILVCLVRLP